jgi:PAS domain S-box-containing protein
METDMPPDDVRPAKTDQLERALKQRTFELNERVKELRCLYRIIRLLYGQSADFQRVLQAVVDALPDGWQYPEIACARLTVGDVVYETENYELTPWQQTAPFNMPDGPGGTLRVCYLEGRPPADEGPFLAEERNLLDAVAEHVQAAVQSRRTQAALRESEGRYRRLAENAPDAIFVFRSLPSPRFEYVSPAAEQITGYPLQAFYDNPYLIAEIAQPDSQDRIISAMGGRWPDNDLVVQLRHRNGSVVWIGVRFVDIRDGDGNIVAIEGIARDITEVYKMGEALRESETRYRRLIETIHEGIWVIDRNRRITFANERMIDILGYTPAEMIGRHVADFMDEEWRCRIPSDFDQHVDRTTHQFDIKLLHRNGDAVWVLASFAPIIEDGERVGTLATVNDITARKQAEQTEREQHVFAETLRDTAAALNSTLDLDELFDLILTNLDRVVPNNTSNIMLIEGDQAHVVELRGYEENMLSRFHTGGIDILTTPGLRQMVETKQPLLIRDVTASDVWVGQPETQWIRSYVGAPIIVENEVIGFLNADSDTPGHFTPEDAQRMRAFAHHAAIAIRNARLLNQLAEHNVMLRQAVETATDEMRQTVDQLRAILNSSPSAVIMAREGLVISSVNPAFTRLFAYEEGEVYGRSLYDLFEGKARLDLQAAVWQIVQGEETAQLEVMAQRRDGTHFDASMALGVVQQDEELIGIVVNIWDVSAFREIERMKDSIIATAAHELRTPLTSVQGYSEILLTRELSEEARRRYLTLINQQAVRLARIISSLLDISLLEAGKGIQFAPHPLDPGDLVDTALLSFTAVSPYHNIRVEKCHANARVRGDPIRLTQVITNLISNAIKYSPEGGVVLVRTGAGEEGVTISVTDEGIGMRTEQQNRVFERFYRADMSNTAVEGAGLGLTISLLIAESHGGHIDIQSALGSGSTFTVILPSADPAE